ncbi:hypothetical protein BH10ACI3_BH10ACI3_15460 [soil metagenome]
MTLWPVSQPRFFMEIRFVTVVLSLMLILSASVSSFAQRTLVVTKTDDTSDGVCDVDCSLREAVIAAGPGNIIVFSGLFNSPQTITLTGGQIAVTKNLTIDGPGTVYLSVSGNNAGRILKISGGVTVNLSGMNFRDGRVGATVAESGGGAILLEGNSTLNLTDMEFMNNFAFNTQSQFGYGGAVCAFEGCTINIDRVYMHNNTARDGAAVRGGDGSGSVSIKDSTINNNIGEAVTGVMVVAGDSTFSRNSETGISGQHLTLTNSTVKGNGTGVSGGTSSGQLLIDKCVIEDNGVEFNDGRGGGVVNASFAGVIRNTVIRNNKKRQDGAGGGITTIRTLYVINSSVIQNTAADGGGIMNSSGHLFLTNSTVSGNVAEGFTPTSLGGGIYSLVNGANPSGQITITNSTIANNFASKGGGIYHESTNQARIRNSIIAGNTNTSAMEKDVSGVFISEGVNLIGTVSGSSGWSTADLLNQDPIIAPLGNNGSGSYTHALLPGSPAINAGDNSFAVDPLTMVSLITDQRGFQRFFGLPSAVVDIGSHEANYSSSPVTVSGRVTTSTGRGANMTRVKLDDDAGNIFYTQTNSAGFYRLPSLQPGTTYTIAISHKLYKFSSPQSFTADQNRNDLDFIGAF